MKSYRDLQHHLRSIDRRGYPAYKGLAGSYDMDGFFLGVDHVQGDPFAAPSSLSVFVPQGYAGFPEHLFDRTCRRLALEDRLLRLFGAALARHSHKVGGSGRSGLLCTTRPGPEVLERSACHVDADGVTLRFEAGFPARGRTVDAEALEEMLLGFIPRCVEGALVYRRLDRAELERVTDLADDQARVREELAERGLVAFVANGSVLPRESGVSQRPLRGAVPFESPRSLEVELCLPHRGAVRGMGVPRGVTLVVGGGYHGKTTLLEALQEGVYDHVEGDGRELAITVRDAVKLRSEDGRPVWDVDVSAFIGRVPSGADTTRFRTADASGSTSQAASLVEAVEGGCKALLIDEDTSATNFMVRDALMEQVVARSSEPITPFIEHARNLYEGQGVSSVLVAGSSGSFFFVADTVIQMDCYRPQDVTDLCRAACLEHPLARPRQAGPHPVGAAGTRFVGQGREGQQGREGGRERAKTRVHGRHIEVGGASCDLSLVEQLVDPEQVQTLASMLAWAQERELLRTHSVSQAAELLLGMLDEGGPEAFCPRGRPCCGYAAPRRQEVFACLNRLRFS